jgi:hypothetical protein
MANFFRVPQDPETEAFVCLEEICYVQVITKKTKQKVEIHFTSGKSMELSGDVAAKFVKRLENTGNLVSILPLNV